MDVRVGAACAALLLAVSGCGSAGQERAEAQPRPKASKAPSVRSLAVDLYAAAEARGAGASWSDDQDPAALAPVYGALADQLGRVADKGEGADALEVATWSAKAADCAELLESTGDYLISDMDAIPVMVDAMGCMRELDESVTRW